jgi:hypothetical protein
MGINGKRVQAVIDLVDDTVVGEDINFHSLGILKESIVFT